MKYLFRSPLSQVNVEYSETILLLHISKAFLLSMFCPGDRTGNKKSVLIFSDIILYRLFLDIKKLNTESLKLIFSYKS